jgi:hypothetical protein
MEKDVKEGASNPEVQKEKFTNICFLVLSKPSIARKV